MRRGRTRLPNYALAMRRDGRFDPDRRIPLDDDQVRTYLAGGHLAGPARGWGVAGYRGLAVGWAEGDG